MADATTVNAGLLKIPSELIAAAESSHMLFRTGSDTIKPDGRLRITIEDVRLHSEALKLVLESLGGRQPSAVSYCQAMQMLDVASC
jgi:hypothetical protein